MTDNSSQRARSNEVISISLIEILLVIVFVLLLLIVAGDRNKTDPLQRIEVCEALKESLRDLVGPRQIAGIDCSMYEKSTLEIISKIKVSLQKMDKDLSPIWAITGITNKPESIEDALVKLTGALNANKSEVEEKLARVTKEASALSSQLEQTKEELLRAEAIIDAKNQEIARLAPDDTGDGLGTGKAPGPCLTLNPKDKYPQSDYIVIVDLSPAGEFDVKLRPMGRHNKTINALIENGVLPSGLNRDDYLTISESKFVSAFRDLKQLGDASTPKCYYQARLLNEETQLQSKVNLVETVLYKGG